MASSSSVRATLSLAAHTQALIRDDESSMLAAMDSSTDAAHQDLGQPGGLQQVFAALANSDRLAILEVLAESAARNPRGVPISKVADKTELTRFSASRHLRILVDAGLVVVERERQSLLHRLSSEGLNAAEDWVVRVTDMLDTAHDDDTDPVDAWGL